MNKLAKLLRCDLCEKDIQSDSAYGLKINANSTKLTKSIDVCHSCCMEKGLFDILAKVTWKKWNPKSFQYETPSN